MSLAVFNPGGGGVVRRTRGGGEGENDPHDISGTNSPIGTIQTPFDSPPQCEPKGYQFDLLSDRSRHREVKNVKFRRN